MSREPDNRRCPVLSMNARCVLDGGHTGDHDFPSREPNAAELDLRATVQRLEADLTHMRGQAGPDSCADYAMRALTAEREVERMRLAVANAHIEAKRSAEDAMTQRGRAVAAERERDEARAEKAETTTQKLAEALRESARRFDVVKDRCGQMTTGNVAHNRVNLAGYASGSAIEARAALKAAGLEGA